jgi:hypothetical protein
MINNNDLKVEILGNEAKGDRATKKDEQVKWCKVMECLQAFL